MKRLILVLFVLLLSSCSVVDPDADKRKVTYLISGSAPSVDITMSNSSEGTEQYSGVAIPWTTSFDSKKDAFLYISAQNNGESGTVSVQISVDGKTFKTASSSGAFVIATASGSAP